MLPFENDLINAIIVIKLLYDFFYIVKYTFNKNITEYKLYFSYNKNITSFCKINLNIKQFYKIKLNSM